MLATEINQACVGFHCYFLFIYVNKINMINIINIINIINVINIIYIINIINKINIIHYVYLLFAGLVVFLLRTLVIKQGLALITRLIRAGRRVS